MTWSILPAAPADPDALQYGEQTGDRRNATEVPVTSGSLHLGYFTATRPLVLTKTRVTVAGTAAGTVTTTRVGLYTATPDGAASLVASTVNDTALLAGSTYTVATKALSSSYTLIPGQRYALGLLVVAGTPPVVLGSYADWALDGRAPRLSGVYEGLSALPASFVDADLVSHGVVPHVSVWEAAG